MTNTIKPMIDAIPTPRQSAEQPRTWTFTSAVTGQPHSVTCMIGCTVDHSSDMATPTHPVDIYCGSYAEDATLPINADGRPEEYRVLGVELRAMPFSPVLAERLPHAVVEVLDEHVIEALDPDGLETVIGTLQERLDAMRATHAQLVETRAAYRGRQA